VLRSRGGGATDEIKPAAAAFTDLHAFAVTIAVETGSDSTEKATHAKPQSSSTSTAAAADSPPLFCRRGSR